MAYRVEFLESSKQELLSPYNWYEETKDELGKQFINEVDTLLKTLQNNPFLFQTVFKDFRQALLNVFPYMIIYKIINDKIVVFAVFHFPYIKKS